MMHVGNVKGLGAIAAAALLACGMAASVPAQEDAAGETAAKMAGGTENQRVNQAANQAAPEKDAGRAVSGKPSGGKFAGLPLQAGVQLRAADPESVVLWPGGARVTVMETLKPQTERGGAKAVFVVPGGARDLDIAVEGGRLLRWSSTPCFLPAQGVLAHERREAQDDLRALRGEQALLRAQLKIWTARPMNLPGMDPEEASSRLEKHVPALTDRLARISDMIAALEKVEKSRPALSDGGRKIVLELKDAGASVTVRYRYTLPGCGWEPRYAFDAIPDESGETARVRVRLEARVRQFSGMDWSGSRLFFALRPHEAVAPRPLPQWIVDEAPEAAPLLARRSAMPLAAAREVNDGVSLNLDGQDARWEIAAPGLPQGESVVTLRDEVWTASLARVARPDENDGRVWLTAEAEPPAGSVWPAGPAVFSLEGIPAGEHHFVAEGGKARLFFGVDPRVTVSVLADGRRRGEAGVVNRRRQWSWAWEYTVNNGRSVPVRVRLERPRPHTVDRSVTVAYDDTPKAVVDEMNDCLFWLLDVPAEGKADVRHGLTISAPVDRKISPVAP